MTVSLDTLLRAGALGDLRPGLSPDAVRALLGPPDAEGGATRRRPRPTQLLYGTVELYFRPHHPHDLTGFGWDAAEKGPFRLAPAVTVADWAFAPDWTPARVEAYLRERSVPFAHQTQPPGNDGPPWPVTAGGVTVAFAQGRLYGVWGWADV